MTKRRKPRAVVEDRIEVAASPEVLWTCFADFSKWPHWFPALVEAEWIAGTPWTRGAQFRQSLRFGFPIGKMTGVATITEISASPYVAWEGKLAGVEAIQGFRFDTTANGSEVLSRHEFYGAMARLHGMLFLRRAVHRTYGAALEGLKNYVEAGTIQLKIPM
jgi:hypothetical protein